MRLHNLKRSLTAHCAVVPWAAVCYVGLFGIMIYSLAVEARLDAWRESSAQVSVTPRDMFPPSTAATSCAVLAGMGQKLCSAEARIDVARERFRQRVAARLQRPVMAPVAVKRLGDRPARAIAERAVLDPTAAVVVPEQTRVELPLNPTIAIRD